MSLEVDLHWVQIVSDKLFDILSYPNIEIKLAAANALGIFCSKIFGTQIMDSTGMKITQTIKSSLDKKNDPLNDLCGHVVALGSLWTHATNYPTVQNNIMNILFDTLKRVDCSIFFRSYAIFSLAIIIKSRCENSQSLQYQGQEEVTLIEKLISLMEIHLIVGSPPLDQSYQNEYPLLFLCLQRLINSAVLLVLEFAPNSTYLIQLSKMWSIIRNSFHISQIQDECADFILSFTTVPTAVDILDIVEFVKDALKSPEKTTARHLSKIVGCIKTLILTDTNIVVEFGLDLELFKLLDWCVATSTASFSSSPFWGVELRSDISPIILGDTIHLQHQIEEVMNLLVLLNVQHHPDRNGTAWVLLCRAIALGLKEQTSAPVVEQSNEENDGTAGETKGGDKEAPLSAMTYIQYSNWCRDIAIERGRFIQTTRLQLKYLSLRCAITAIIECKTSSNSNSHSNLLLARKLTHERLTTLSTSTNKDDLVSIPCYLSLFMNDLITMGCACATFSIDDHRLLGLQTISIEYLQAIVDLFWNTLDPDDVNNAITSSSSAVAATVSTSISAVNSFDDQYPFELDGIFIKPERKIMNQYMAQIISAIRPTLSAEWSPSLLWASGNLIFGFISSGLLTDKIIIKRLIKSFLLPLESTEIPYKPRCLPSLAVRAEISIIQHINIATNMARIYLLSTPYCFKFGSIDLTIQETIRSSFGSHLEEVYEVWMGIIIDTSRLLQGHNMWPKITTETDCRRGGLSYPPQLDCLKIYRYYLYSLPYLLGALSMSSHLFPSIETHLTFLSINFVAIQYLHESQVSTNKEEMMVNMSGNLNDMTFAGSDDDMIETQFIYQNIQTLSKPLLFASFNILLQQFYSFQSPSTAASTPSVASSTAASSSSASSSSPSLLYPIDEQITTIKYLTESLISDHSLHIPSTRLDETRIQFTLLSEIFHSILTHVEMPSNDPNNGSTNNDNQNEVQGIISRPFELILTLWISHITILRSLFSGMFVEFITTDGEDLNIYTTQYIFPLISFQSYGTFKSNPSSVYWINNSKGLQLIESLLRNLVLILNWTATAGATTTTTGVSAQETSGLGSYREIFQLFCQYYLDVLVNILNYSTLYVIKFDSKRYLFSLLQDLFLKLNQFIPGLVFDGLMSQLWKWQQLSITALQSTDSIQSTPFPPSPTPIHSHHNTTAQHQQQQQQNEVNQGVITEISQVIYEMWLTLAVEASNSLSLVQMGNERVCTLPSTCQLTAILVSTSTPDCYLNGILLAAIKYLQSQSNSSKSLHTAMTLLFPTLISIIPHLLSSRLTTRPSPTPTISSSPTAPPPPQSEIIMLQLLFLILNLSLLDEIKTIHLKLILPSLCFLIQTRGFQDPISLICGKGITHIARNIPGVFKSEVMLIDENNKLILQKIMKIVLEQQQQQQQSQSQGQGNSHGSMAASQGTGGGSGSSSTGGSNNQPSSLKIDMNKFKKPTPAVVPVSVPAPPPVVVREITADEIVNKENE